MLNADAVSAEVRGAEVLVSSSIGSSLAVPDRLWFSLPSNLRPEVAADADPLLPVLMIVGMAHRTPIRLPEVSSELAAGCARIMEIYEGWSASLGDRLHRIDVKAPTTSRARVGRAAGAFFSGGVDSTYTVLRNHDRYPEGDARRIQYLVLGHGLDIALDNEGLFEKVLATATAFARAHGVQLIPVRTNARAFTTGIDWGRYAHGPCLAAVGHVLSPLLHTLYIASSYWFTTLKPWGSHPDVDARWSSERLEFVHHGLDATRGDKMRRIASADAALKTLRVCWRNLGGEFNCGRCEKCLRTMFALSCCGALERAPTFPSRLDPDLVAGLRLKPAEVPFWEDNLRLGAEPAADPVLVQAAARMIERSRQPAVVRHAESPLTRAFARVGLSPAQIKQWDERHLGSTLTRAFRALTRRPGA